MLIKLGDKLYAACKQRVLPARVRGLPVDQSIREGMMEKFRAVLMTGIVPAIGFAPCCRAWCAPSGS